MQKLKDRWLRGDLNDCSKACERGAKTSASRFFAPLSILAGRLTSAMEQPISDKAYFTHRIHQRQLLTLQNIFLFSLAA